jgi:peptidyl-prolyl cis-trans isomerase SurA
MKFKPIYIILLPFIFQIYLQAQQPVVIDQVIAIVGSKSIKQSDLENEYFQARAQGMSAYEGLKCEIFESLLKQKLLLNQAMLDSVVVPESQVENNLNQRMNAEISRVGSVEKIENQYKKSISQIKEDFKDDMRDMLLVQKMQETIIEKLKITPSETRSFYNKLPKDSIPMIDEQVEFAQIALYPAYSEQAVLDVKDKLLALRKRILDGENFAALAGFYSEDEGTAKRGGETGFLSKSEMEPEYAKAAYALYKSGDVSRIIEDKLGYHIIQLIDKRGDQINTRQILMRPKPDADAVQNAKSKLDSIAQLIRKDSVTFDNAVKSYSMDENTRFNHGMMVNPVVGGTKFTREQLAAADYYAVKNLKVSEISSPFESRDKNNKVFYKIVILESKTPAHRADLKDDFNLIQEMAKNFKKISVLNNWINEKINTTYIHIDDEFKNCNFSSKWLKAGM